PAPAPQYYAPQQPQYYAPMPAMPQMPPMPGYYPQPMPPGYYPQMPQMPPQMPQMQPAAPAEEEEEFVLKPGAGFDGYEVTAPAAKPKKASKPKQPRAPQPQAAPVTVDDFLQKTKSVSTWGSADAQLVESSDTSGDMEAVVIKPKSKNPALELYYQQQQQMAQSQEVYDDDGGEYDYSEYEEE
ncbi:MAG: hypothetical protein FWD35_04930, partial [Oscillospiraceae bacterium]|nr:hypothetical protein [Oscillospiraceae bacterium]